MNDQVFNYRTQLIHIFYCLQDFADGTYANAFNLALNGELSSFREVIEDGDEVPGDLNYLKALESPAVQGMVKMIECVFSMQQSLLNLNALDPEQFELPEQSPGSDVDEEENAATEAFEPPQDDYLLFAFTGQMDLFILTWQLANASVKVPDEVIQTFETHFFEGTLSLESSDSNVLVLINGINEILQINSSINYEEEN
jgi:hypothetical protein